MAGDARGPSTRAVHAGLPAPARASRSSRAGVRRAVPPQATSFGGLHSSAERRDRLGTDAVPGRFIRFRNGIEDADIVGDVTDALDATR